MLSAKSILFEQIKKLDVNNIDINIKYSTNNNIYNYINYVQIKKLNDIKEYICNLKNWNIYRKLFTPLTLLNICNTKYNNIGIFNKKVLSRSYFKMIEIQNVYNIFKKFNYNIKAVFIAEAPGGFIESFYDLRKLYNDNYYGISLIKKTKNIPNWNNLKKKILKD